MRRVRPFLSTFAALVCGIALTGCGGSTGTGSAGQSKGSEVIAIDGSSTVFPLTEAIAEQYMKQRAGTKVTVSEAGTGTGIARFCRNEIVIADASRPINATEIENCTKANIQFIELPVAYDGLTVVVNPKNTWASSMTVAELKTLWNADAQSKVTRWSQVRPGWPDREIHLFGPGTASGTFDFFTEVINGKADVSRGDYTASEDDNVLVQGVARDELALGYFGLAYYEQNKDQLNAVPIDDGKPENGEGPIAPTFETVRGGTYRPLSRPLFIYVNTAALARPEVQGFVEFYQKADAALIREIGYVALTDIERGLAQQRFSGKVAGTMYGSGAPTMTLEERLKGR
jgi:phosphate transport system substrate-binding protein